MQGLVSVGLRGLGYRVLGLGCLSHLLHKRVHAAGLPCIDRTKVIQNTALLWRFVDPYDEGSCFLHGYLLV